MSYMRGVLGFQVKGMRRLGFRMQDKERIKELGEEGNSRRGGGLKLQKN